MIQLGKNTFFFVFFTILLSCEYELEKEFFNEVQKPDSIRQLDLYLMPDKDTIEVFNTVNLIFNVETSGLKMHKISLFLNERVYDFFDNNGNFYVSPQNYNPGYYNFKIEALVSSGSGSVADFVGGEGYLIEKEGVLLIDGRDVPELSLSHSLTEGGYLKISWPKNEQLNFDSYEILSAYDFHHTIKDADTNFFIDSGYFGGEKTYTVKSFVKSSKNDYLTNSIAINDTFPELNFTELGLDSLRIYWDKSKYNCTYKLVRNGVTTFLDSSKDTSVVVPQSSIGQKTGFELSIFPDFKKESTYLIVESIYKRYFFGNKLTGRKGSKLTYNPIEQVVYFNDDDDNLKACDLLTMNVLNSYHIKSLYYNTQLSSLSKSSTLAVFGLKNIYVFENKHLISPQIISYPKGVNNIDHFHMVSENLLGIAANGEYNLFSIIDKQIISTFKIDEYPTTNQSELISTSSDGKFVCVATSKGMNIFKISNGVIEKYYSDTKVYKSVVFDHEDPEKLILTLKNEPVLEIRNVLDFSLIDDINLPTEAMAFRNIDPESGYYLLTDHQDLYLIDKVNSNVVLKLDSENEYFAHLYGNKIFSSTGYWLDISKYLPQ